jgi:lon-related putative ATP-dependent protease
MPRKPKRTQLSDRHRLVGSRLRWRCDPTLFTFKTTADMSDSPIKLIGQPRALEALELGLQLRSDGHNIFVCGGVGSGRSTVVRRMLADLKPEDVVLDDLVYVQNFIDHDSPCRLIFQAGQGCAFKAGVAEFIGGLAKDIPLQFESVEYGRQRTVTLEKAAARQRAELKDFEKGVEESGFVLVQTEGVPVAHPQLLPTVDGAPVEMDQLELLVEQGRFEAKALNVLKKKMSLLRTEMDSVGKRLRAVDRELQRKLETLDKEIVRPLVEDTAAELSEAFTAEGLTSYLNLLVTDILEEISLFRAQPEGQEPVTQLPRYQVNVVVDNSRTKGRPIIWEGAPTYRHLFGTIDTTRTAAGEWSTNHMRIKTGSLSRANGGFLVFDAMDMLTQPGVWSELKRTLRTHEVEIQAYEQHAMMTGVSLTPQSAPIDVKVLMIGTNQIYRYMQAADEDFSYIFKIKAEFAGRTSLSNGELENYASFVHKRIKEAGMPPFHRDAVAAVVEESVRLAGSRDKLTTRFNLVGDIVCEAGFWARKAGARVVRSKHVDESLEKRNNRVNMVEAFMREHYVDGTVLLSIEGEAVGQVNGLTVIDLGDHRFGQPVRITASTAMGRQGIIDIGRESEMTGSTHTKGLLILSGFLRSRFAQKKPLTLTASICFEQTYGPVDGDSASSAELYALLSSLSGVPLRQGVAVTGSVNQKGEIQPIGGVNEKIEGFFDLCTARGLTGEQGVMIPQPNLGQLMLRKNLVAAVKKGQFHVWAVSTIEEGLETLTGQKAGTRRQNGSFPPGSIFEKADAELKRLGEALVALGRADGEPVS